jgi:hypothetical protein
MLSIHCDSVARLGRTSQFDDQFPHIDRQRAGEDKAISTDRMVEAEPSRVKCLAGEADLGEQRANRRG